jgi:hypothetical protein
MRYYISEAGIKIEEANKQKEEMKSTKDNED